MKTIYFLLLAMACWAAIADEGSTPLPKKLIMTGWDSPDTAQFRRDIHSMEQWPFDGAVIYTQGLGSDGKPFDARTAFNTNHWGSTCFSNALADLKAARSDKFTDNFLIFGANPGNVDWFDDAGWKEIQEHWRLLARLAHEGGLRGLLVNPPSSPWYIDGLGGRRVDRLEQNVAGALRAADQYVWVYGERARWWPPREPGATAPKTWAEVLPGSEFALLSAKDPAEAARHKLTEMRSEGTLTNLLLNGDFTAGKDGQPESWGHWQDEQQSHVSFSHDPALGATRIGSGCLSGIEHGCFVQAVKVGPGQRYLLSAKLPQSGEGAACLMARWQTAEGKWTAEDRDVRFAPEPRAADSSSWREVTGLVSVPASAGQLVVLAGASGQQNQDDRVWFDDVLVAPATPSSNILWTIIWKRAHSVWPMCAWSSIATRMRDSPT